MIKKFLTKLRYMLFRRSDSEIVDSQPMQDTGITPPKGINGVLDAEVALLFDAAATTVLTVECEFDDMPAWIEGDPSTGSIYIVQTGGAVAKLRLKLPPKEMERWTNLKRIALVSNIGREKLMQNVAFTLQTR
ncbi:MAG: hypothetical protein EA357_06055 [Micavibrio sp.]|nr:MAG: hypothetical protein EA357_06055 [Micavibrio sp.]